VNIEFYEGKAMERGIAAQVDLTVVETEPGLEGRFRFERHKSGEARNWIGSASSSFINEGEKIRVSTLGRHLPERARSVL